MSWVAIARKDFLDAARSKTLWGLLVLFVGYLGIITYLSQGQDAELLQFIELTAAGFVLFVPLVSIILGYKAIVDERESGTIALLLSLPHTRREMVLGKLVGRSVVLAIPVLVGLLGASAVIAVLFDSFPVVEYLLFALLSVLLGVAFLGIAIGLSMSTTSNRRVTTGAFGAYVVLGILWQDVVNAILLLLWRFDSEPFLTHRSGRRSFSSPHRWSRSTVLLLRCSISISHRRIRVLAHHGSPRPGSPHSCWSVGSSSRSQSGTRRSPGSTSESCLRNSSLESNPQTRC
ncbi:ABC transporter permease [Halovenus salina]|uniref:ABC transporter permease n=1 Tax=Halovenus salina TaxID=1510225 RepID=A0ABD5W3Y7_9EURY